jgi:hypothetical protein
VPLSEHEQRLLEQMERALYAEDPKFASSLRSAAPRPGGRRRAVVGVVGFLVMLGGSFLVITSLRPQREAPAAGSRPTPPVKGKAKASKTGFMDRVEERFRKRREGDGG